MNAEHIKNGIAQTATVELLKNRLNEEKTVQAIDRLLDRIDTLEKAVASLTNMIEQGPGLVAMTMDMVDEGYQKTDSNGVNIENRLGAALHIAEKLTAPEMVKKLDSLLSLADQAPGLMAMTTDIIDEGIQKADSNGVNIENRLGAALHIAEKLTAPEMVEKLDGLLSFAEQAPGLVAMTVDIIDEGVKKAASSDIDINALSDVTKQMSTAISTAKKLPDAKIGGIFSMVKAMRDPDRQVAVGYLMNIAKALGQELKK